MIRLSPNANLSADDGVRQDTKENHRRIGLSLLTLGAFIYLFTGIAVERTATGGMADFKAVYFASRCLVQHADPYRPGEFVRVYLREGGSSAKNSLETGALQKAITVCINLPTALLIVFPLTLLPWNIASIVWSTLTACSYFLAAFLLWEASKNDEPILSGSLIGFVLATSQVLFAGGNTAGIAVSFGLISIWCFLRERHEVAGVFCLTIGLLLKPHDLALIWLFFLLSSAARRKRALQTSLCAAVLGLPAIVWASAVAPEWPRELRSNLQTVSAPGEINDPGPASITYRSPATVIDLQSAISIFCEDPTVCNEISFGICGALGAIWLFATLHSAEANAHAWLGLVPLATLTLLVTYHHPYDARVLLLSVPPVVALWKRAGLVGWAALVACAISLIVNADIPIVILKMLTGSISSGLSGRLAMLFLAHPQPLVLLCMTVFFLVVYIRRLSNDRPAGPLTPLPSPADR